MSLAVGAKMFSSILEILLRAVIGTLAIWWSWNHLGPEYGSATSVVVTILIYGRHQHHACCVKRQDPGILTHRRLEILYERLLIASVTATVYLAALSLAPLARLSPIAVQLTAGFAAAASLAAFLILGFLADRKESLRSRLL